MFQIYSKKMSDPPPAKKMALRGKDDNLEGTTFRSLSEFPGTQVPTGVEVVGRMIFLLRPENRNFSSTKQEIAGTVAQEIENLFIHKLNIYPVMTANIRAKVLSDYENFKKFLNHPAVKKVNPGYKARVEPFLKKLKAGYDIKTNDAKREKELSKLHGVKFGPQEAALYDDNTCIKSCPCSETAVSKCPLCPRQIFASTVDMKWFEDEIKKQEVLENAAKAKKKSDNDIEKQFTKVALDKPVVVDSEKSDVNFIPSEAPSIDIFASPASQSMKLRSSTPVSSSSIPSPGPEASPAFPKLPVRFGRKTLNPKVMVTVVHIAAKYEISFNTVRKVFCDIANMVFGQDYSCEPESEDASDVVGDQEKQDASDKVNIVNIGDTDLEEECQPRKKKRTEADLTFRFPTRKTISSWLKDGAILSLRHLGNIILNKKDAVLTWGTDDTVKKAGNRLHDSKTSHITLQGPGTPRQTFTTGFDPNISHTGADSAYSLNTKLEMLAVLTSQTPDHLKNLIDFWIGDRADDVTKALEILGVESKKVLRCSAHITLGADTAVDKVFKMFENQIGVQNLIELTAGQSNFMNNNSVFTMAMLAISKLLSYSHATLPYSLCVVYKNWRKTEGLDTKDFKGFSSNRFGRTAHLAKLFVQHRDDLVSFFDQCVDEQANKLVLAVSNYVVSDWLFMCAQAYCTVGELFIVPLCDILGIDQSKNQKNPNRSWPKVKEFLEERIVAMNRLVEETGEGSALEKLTSSAVKDGGGCDGQKADGRNGVS